MSRPAIVSRRTVAAGAVWALPVIEHAVSAPIFAVSCAPGCPTVGFPTVPTSATTAYPDAPNFIDYVDNTTITRAGWTFTGLTTTDGGTSGIVANHMDNNGTTIIDGTQAFQAQADPTGSGAYVQASTSFCAEKGVKLTFTVDYIWNDANSYNGYNPGVASKSALLEISVDGSLLATKNSVSTGEAGYHTGTFTFSYTPLLTSYITYQMKVSLPGNDGMSDDFVVAAPTIVCG
ncbi:MAG: hypothetical protein V9E81_03170 [Marmoricola sp.]